jgi:hypothetical protein
MFPEVAYAFMCTRHSNKVIGPDLHHLHLMTSSCSVFSVTNCRCRASLHSPAQVHTPGVSARPLQCPPHQLQWSATTLQQQPPAALLFCRKETFYCLPSRLLLAMHPAPTRSKASTLTTTTTPPATSLPPRPEATCHQCRTCGGPAGMESLHQGRVHMHRHLHSAPALMRC